MIEMNNHIRTLQRLLFAPLFSTAAILALLTSPASAFKPEQTSLAEQVQRAQLICVVEIAKVDPVYSGAIIQTLKSPEGFDKEIIEFKSVSLRPEDQPTIKKGAKLLVLLRATEGKNWELAAYGGQAVWPKSAKEWPYSESHVASMEATLDTVKTLLLPNSNSDEAIKALVSSPVVFKRLVGLEILARSDSLKAYPLSVAEASRREADAEGDVSRLAKSVSSKAGAADPK